MKTGRLPNEINGKTIWKHPLELGLCLLLLGIVITTFLQVLFRFFRLPLGWTEELATFLFMWVAALSIGYAFKTKSHFALMFVVDRFNKKIQWYISSFVSFITVIFLIIFTWKAVEYTISSSDHYGPGTGLSMGIPYSSSVFAGAIMLYYVVRNWLKEKDNWTLTKKRDK
ncbi:TRAP transporter small permease [Ulvibacterium sp.]|uniref:TRAP transporter small permease n=1 Tax=Ulvibacterium sp. TaxID=2665914 RepID=UPI0026238633|nr:TRAP transporter small permease [Ulvibacterium sp.]